MKLIIKILKYFLNKIKWQNLDKNVAVLKKYQNMLLFIYFFKRQWENVCCKTRNHPQTSHTTHKSPKSSTNQKHPQTSQTSHKLAEPPTRQP